jgi:3'(2'), 5'-bisphosphate nucleotidase
MASDDAMGIDTADDATLAAALAEGAGRRLIELRGSGQTSGEAGDRAANHFLVEALRRARPADGLLSEEMRCDGSRLAYRRTWIVDPVDGTREYAEGRADWAVHVGLAIDGVASVGAVALPAEGLVFRSDRATALAALPPVPRMVVSRSRAAAAVLAVAGTLGATVIAMGSAGAKAMAVVRGDADIYLHLGGQYQWDSAAPVAVAVAHGLHCSRANGDALRYNVDDPYLPDLLICRREWAAPVIAALAAATRTA